MTYIKQIYTATAFIRVSGLKLWSLGDCNCAITSGLRLSAKKHNYSDLGPIVLTRASHGRIHLYTVNYIFYFKDGCIITTYFILGTIDM